ncbi:MAG: hypothetical protein WAM70_08680, partial [Pyrinomonadaceae bacterium]
MTHRTKWNPLLLLLAIFSRRSRGMTSCDPTLPPDGFQLRNLSNRRVSFWLGTSAGEWAAFRLDPGDRRIYQGRDRIWITAANQKPLQCKLAFGQRYAIKQLLG